MIYTSEGIFVNEHVRQDVERALERMRKVIASEVEHGAARRVPSPAPEIVQADTMRPATPQRIPLDEADGARQDERAEAAADRLMVNTEARQGAKFSSLEVRPIMGSAMKRKRFVVVDTARRRGGDRGTYGTIKAALRSFPRAIVTPAAREYAMTLESLPAGDDGGML